MISRKRGDKWDESKGIKNIRMDYDMYSNVNVCFHSHRLWITYMEWRVVSYKPMLWLSTHSLWGDIWFYAREEGLPLMMANLPGVLWRNRRNYSTLESVLAWNVFLGKDWWNLVISFSTFYNNRKKISMVSKRVWKHGGENNENKRTLSRNKWKL